MPDMSIGIKEALAKAQQLIPPMLEHFHKGQLGRVAVIGGSENYTGAPYFSAMASARLGCDMSHIICTVPAAAIIKTYSPNLMVHPLMQESSHATQSASSLADKVKEMLSRLHVLVIGPGLGRDPLMHETVSLVIQAAREKKIPIVLDADALLIVGENPSIVEGYDLAVLTPNVVEFSRLCDKLSVKTDGLSATHGAVALSRRLKGPIIVRKGGSDIVADARGHAIEVDIPGGKKRSGGQGDTLTGTIGTLLAWRKAYHERLWKTEGEDKGGKLSEGETVALAAVGGCAVTREASRRAFRKFGRSLQAGDLTGEVHGAFLGLFPGIDGSEE